MNVGDLVMVYNEGRETPWKDMIGEVTKINHPWVVCVEFRKENQQGTFGLSNLRVLTPLEVLARESSR
jgi:hypothetical protein